jgi:uncharacterized protein
LSHVHIVRLLISRQCLPSRTEVSIRWFDPCLEDGQGVFIEMASLHWLALLLVIVGAINWGLVGLFQVDLVATLFGGADSALSRVVYILVGLAGVVVAFTSAAVSSPRRAASAM